MAKDEAQERHVGHAIAITQEGAEMVNTEPHYKHECCEAQNRAMADFEAKLAQGAPETVYSSGEDGASAGAISVGYSKSYAAGYDSVFGKN